MAFADYVTLEKGVQVAAVAAIGVYSYQREMLNALGAFTAFAMGAAIVFFTNIFWLLLLVALLGLGSAATRFRYAEKAARKVAEKAGGRRRSRNVIANGLVPTVAAVASPLVVDQWGGAAAAVTYVTAVAVAASDTLASEFGSLSKRVIMITTLKPVPAGTDGGVSLVGQLAALGGAASIALLGAFFCGVLTIGAWAMPVNAWTIGIPAVMGFVGCQIDSVLGGTLEVHGLVTKEEVNFLSIAAATLGAFGIGVLVL